jgi:16S rRNA (guanine527-N7)-methyltransferase
MSSTALGPRSCADECLPAGSPERPARPARLDAELAALVARFGLEPGLAPRLAALLGLLCSDPLAPTSIRDPARALELHLADALVALELPELACARLVVDVGSGAGLPGLPLALALPRARFMLLEASSRKCAFIARAAAACGADNATAIGARAEEWREGLASADLATARALAPLDVTLELAAPLLRVGGALVVWRGRRAADEERAAARAAAELGLIPSEIQAVRPFPAAAHRHLHVFRKARETPPAFPRRPGIARKRPLGGAPGGPGGRGRARRVPARGGFACEGVEERPGRRGPVSDRARR